MKVWAQVNLGHCGGFWFMQICRAHSDVWAWAEAPTNPKYSPALKPGETLVDYIEREHRQNTYKSLGFVKSGTAVDYCAEHGRVARFIRNPIEVVGKKTDQYWQSVTEPGPTTPDLSSHVAQVEKNIGRPMETEMDHFEGHVIELRRLHRWLLHGLPKTWPLVRLETFDRSIGTDGLYFRRMMEWLTQVEWSPAMAEHVREHLLPNPASVEDEPLDLPPHGLWEAHGWMYDPLPLSRWDGWSQQKRRVFLDNFEDIMLEVGYGWPSNA